MRRQRFLLQVAYDSPGGKLDELVEGIRRPILEHPLTNKTNFQVRFNSFSECGLDILVIVPLDIQDCSVEIREREAILLQIMDIITSSTSTSRLQRARCKPRPRRLWQGSWRSPVTLAVLLKRRGPGPC
jgi:hypothetical protein